MNQLNYYYTIFLTRDDYLKSIILINIIVNGIFYIATLSINTVVIILIVIIASVIFWYFY